MFGSLIPYIRFDYWFPHTHPTFLPLKSGFLILLCKICSVGGHSWKCEEFILKTRRHLLPGRQSVKIICKKRSNLFFSCLKLRKCSLSNKKKVKGTWLQSTTILSYTTPIVMNGICTMAHSLQPDMHTPTSMVACGMLPTDWHKWGGGTAKSKKEKGFS